MSTQQSPDQKSKYPASVTQFDRNPTTIVYSRKKATQRNIVSQNNIQQGQESKPDPLVQNTNIDAETLIENTADMESTSQPESSDLSQPIALRKGTRECRNRPLYPLSNYISYDKLSPGFRKFALSL